MPFVQRLFKKLFFIFTYLKYISMASANKGLYLPRNTFEDVKVCKEVQR